MSEARGVARAAVPMGGRMRRRFWWAGGKPPPGRLSACANTPLPPLRALRRRARNARARPSTHGNKRRIAENATKPSVSSTRSIPFAVPQDVELNLPFCKLRLVRLFLDDAQFQLFLRGVQLVQTALSRSVENTRLDSIVDCFPYLSVADVWRIIRCSLAPVAPNARTTKYTAKALSMFFRLCRIPEIKLRSTCLTRTVVTPRAFR